MAVNELKIGLVGLDTSHVTAFASLLNDPSNKAHVPGGKITAAYPGGSKDFELSWSRVEGFTKTLREKYAVKMMDTPEAVAEAVDLVLITSVDGRVHREQFERTAKFKRPTFIDKPLAVSVEDAEAVLRAARAEKVPVMSCSSVRYSDNVVEALGGKRDEVVACDAHGPLSEVPTQPGLYFYGVHTVDLIVSVLGHGCTEVRAAKYDTGDVLTLAWPGGRVATARLIKGGHGHFGITLHRKAGAQFIDASAAKRPAYASMLEAILRSLPQGKSDVPEDEMLDTIRIIDAANRSRETGQAVKL
jgi:predicted dehydrogenase